LNETLALPGYEILISFKIEDLIGFIV